MGKRKSRKAPTVSRKKEKLDTKFDCPFCNHEKAVTAKMCGAPPPPPPPPPGAAWGGGCGALTTGCAGMGGRDFDVKIGTVSCTLCEASYETKIHRAMPP